jgi:TRAP-type C4-dicarboxylate transport system permease small subunit
MADLSGETGTTRAAEQRKALPAWWRRLDAGLLMATHVAIFGVGGLFVCLITLEVISRYVFDLSLSFVNGGSRLLLVWFFLLGAGPALREGANVGFELILRALPDRRRRAMILLGYLLVLAFFLEMFCSGLYLLGPGLRQSWAGMEISFFWAAIGVPIGFGLAIYHLTVLGFLLYRQSAEPAAP